MEHPSDQAAPLALGRFLAIALELMLLGVIVWLFEIESQRHLLPVLCLMGAGFAVHAWLPHRFRLPVFTLLSIASILLILGVANGFWVLGIGGTLIGVCYLPLGFRVRIVFLIVAAAGLAAMRIQFPMPFWPILGAMFMFRLILFVFERRKATDRPPLAETLSYFFMAPNVCFPLFPVVDYRTFSKSRFSTDESETYQRGVNWMVRGLAHLLLYRVVKQWLVPEQYQLNDLPHVALFMAANYALYLQVSGQFHLIVGLLHLFGFHLPRTHHNYFLASSFTDVWRRINIYWKDFMMKVFFFPAFHAARHRGAALGPAVVVGVGCVFLATWLLHSWQTFWLLGAFPLALSDACLWLLAGACVAVNSLWETSRKSPVEAPAWRKAVGLSLRTVGMFTLVSFFWAYWTDPGFPVLLRDALSSPGVGGGLLLVAAWLVAAVAVLTILNLAARAGRQRQQPAAPFRFRESAQLHIAGLGLLAALSSPALAMLLGENAGAAIAAIRTDSGGGGVESRLQGYYEQLNTAEIQAGPFLLALSPATGAEEDQALGFNRVSQPADVYQAVELIPNLSLELDKGQFTVNRFGMRDRTSLTREKPAGTTRIALLGSSIVMGSGVADDQTFGRLLENDLNSMQPDPSTRFEVLNFGVGKQWPTHRLVRLNRKVFDFEPDALFYIAHQDEFSSLASHTARLLAEGRELPTMELESVARLAGVDAEMAPGGIQARLQRHDAELLAAVYRGIVNACRARGAIPVYFYLPIPGTTPSPEQPFLKIAEESGFIVSDLSNWAAGRAHNDLYHPDDEIHPDPRGHAAIKEAILHAIEAQPAILPTP